MRQFYCNRLYVLFNPLVPGLQQGRIKVNFNKVCDCVHGELIEPVSGMGPVPISDWSAAGNNQHKATSVHSLVKATEGYSGVMGVEQGGSSRSNRFRKRWWSFMGPQLGGIQEKAKWNWSCPLFWYSVLSVGVVVLDFVLVFWGNFPPFCFVGGVFLGGYHRDFS